ncbi:hypothetical protein [Micromonospora cathayae]|uniref:Uncharacterized protein n=1 Tax=Micromonospora cathayae TaxID=3028804 RepID=A0ABY7ZND8_9ACTN|nr:hypothetical protein [Micromonospora sp. HUAS 3]WDZ84018.1 hypothetical protein PVK37_26680 [Micromonospora sp. HUAS 3]
MGLRALVGIEGADGTYLARHVQHDGCPTMVVPALSVLLHDLCDHNAETAVATLLHSDWSRLYALPATGPTGRLVGVPSEGREPQVGNIAETPAGDREWAYLFGAHRLHVYLGVLPERGPKRWRAWACWSVGELPSLTQLDLLDVQKAGYAVQWQASGYRQYMAAVRAAFREGAR